MPLGTGSLQIELNGIRKHLLVEHGLDPTSSDNRIIGAALGQAERGSTTMLSNDAALADQGGPPRRGRRRAPADPPSGVDDGRRWSTIDALSA